MSSQYGQLNDEYLRDLSDDQLIFLAARPSRGEPRIGSRIERASLKDVSPGLQYERQKRKVDDLAAIKNKLEQNARRARLDLDRRRERVTRRLTAAMVLVAAFIGLAGGITGALIGRW